MKTLEITGEKREDTGKKNAKILRRNGKVPCILYGGKEQTFFSAEEKSFKNLVYTPDLFAVRLKIEGKEIGAVMQDIQFHPVSDTILLPSGKVISTLPLLGELMVIIVV